MLQAMTLIESRNTSAAGKMDSLSHMIQVQKDEQPSCHIDPRKCREVAVEGLFLTGL